MLLPTRNVRICEYMMFLIIVATLCPQMVHNPNVPQMVHFFIKSINYTQKQVHSIL